MRVTLVALFFLIGAGAAHAQIQANLLVNPGFEQELAGWTAYGNGRYTETRNNIYYNNNTSAGASNVLVWEGLRVQKVFGEFTGTANYDGVFQDIPAQPGTSWSATAKFLTHQQDRMGGANQCWLEVTFRSATDSVLATFKSKTLTAASAPNVWHDMDVTNQSGGLTLTAPAGTTKARLQEVFYQPSNDGGSVYADGMSLGQVAASGSIPAWRLTWSDEFAQADGSAPAATNWINETGTSGGSGWGNAELETYTARRVNSRIESGALVIEALRENRTESDGFARNYTSARLKTQGLRSWTSGRVEARLKLPRGQGIWPAFWMLGENITTVPWPGCGEIDIMENIGREPAIVHGTLHGPGYSGASPITGQKTVPGTNGTALANDFHLFAIEWETNRIRWFLDNVQYYTATPASLPAGTTWVFDKPQFILLNLAVGGTWPGSPDGTTIFPQRLAVDYVRVFARTSAPAAALEIKRESSAVKASWPLEFPHARLQRITVIGEAWQDVPMTGVIENGRLTEIVSGGFYRLLWQ